MVNNQPVCTCAPGWYGQFCSTNIPCQSGTNNSSPCLNGGTCTDQPTGYKCRCPGNIFGTNCQFIVSSTTCAGGDMSVADCQRWAARGFCDRKFLFQDIPVPFYCPQSCAGTCAIQACNDSQPNCAYWSSLKLCDYINERNPNLCPKSCGLCNFRRK